MTYREKINKLKSLSKFITGKYESDIMLVLDKRFKYDAWSLICAVMHWFDVVIPYLDCRNVLKKNTKDYNWGNVYLYLCSVDIITKGIDDLYKMINNTTKHLFQDDKSIFKNKSKNDNQYFQNIRAIFGAHPTDLDGNGEFFVATYPTPYNWNLDQIRGNDRKWDYYTLLWSKKKSKTLFQKSIGFSFYNIDKYLDKRIEYLEKFYQDINKMINNYYMELLNKPIPRVKNVTKQIDILIRMDKSRFNGRYGYILKKYKLLIGCEITDQNNKIEYDNYRKVLISKINRVINVIQNPVKYKYLLFLEKIMDCDNTDNNVYYNSKLSEYYNNLDMEHELINYYGDKIKPFNSNIKSIEELYCIVKARNYYESNN